MSDMAADGEERIAGLTLKEQLARIDNLMADTQKKRRDFELAPWQIFIALIAGAAGFFAAGAACFAAAMAFVKFMGL